MSSLLGSPSDRWTLAQAVDALAESARLAGVPGLIWFAGVFYPSLNINVDLVRSLLRIVHDLSGIEIPAAGEVSPIVFLFAPRLPGVTGWERLLLLPWIALIYRLIVGLAKVSDPRTWEEESSESSVQVHLGVIDLEHLRPRRTVSMRAAWRAGRGLGLVAFGMWLMLLALLLGAMLFLIGPLLALVALFGLSEFSPLFTGLLLPILCLLLAYAIVLMVLNQLALHSLAHNRRGVASALTHAWRLVRASPWSALRATLADFVLFVSILVAAHVLSGFLGATGVFAFLAPVVVLGLYGFGGVARALFWARTYRALGGLSSVDHVPGL